MKQALRQLLSDFLSAILFLVVYAVSGSLFAAAGIAVAAGLAQLARLRLTRRRIEPMQWMSLGLVVVLGGATMLTQSPRFMMIKPTIVHFADCDRCDSSVEVFRQATACAVRALSRRPLPARDDGDVPRRMRRLWSDRCVSV